MHFVRRPNKPFRESFTPQLQTLSLSAAAAGGGGGVLASASRRFGFVEWSEARGANRTWYTVNGPSMPALNT